LTSEGGRLFCTHSTIAGASSAALVAISGEPLRRARSAIQLAAVLGSRPICSDLPDLLDFKALRPDRLGPASIVHEGGAARQNTAARSLISSRSPWGAHE
jgi:hypothetical protein